MVSPRPSKINIVICDDSPFMRRVISEIVIADESIKVLKTYGSGKEMLEELKRMKPTVVVLDYHMPEMNGIDVLRAMMKVRPTPTVMLTGHIEEGTEEALQAYESGAVAIVSKPGGSYSLSLKEVTEELINEIKNASVVRPEKIKKFISSTLVAILSKSKLKTSFPIVVVGASTGGPAVLERMIPQFPVNFKGTILIAQHMPEHLTGMMARRLSQMSKINVKEASDNEPIHPGMAYIAPGRHHMLVEADDRGLPIIRLRDEKLYIGAAPSVDMLFESGARIFGAATFGVVLSGTGRDGLVGSKVIKDLGGKVLVQDQDSALVFGMGGEVVQRNLSDFILPPEGIVKKITELIK